MHPIETAKVKGVGIVFLRRLTHPDKICRACGKTASTEATTEKKIKNMSFAIPCCDNQVCYNTAMGIIESMAILLKKLLKGAGR